MANDPFVEHLAAGWLGGTLTDEEVREFLILLEQAEEPIPAIVLEWLDDPGFVGWADLAREEALFRRVMEKARAAEGEGASEAVGADEAHAAGEARVRRMPFRRWAVAAVLIGLLGIGLWVWLGGRRSDSKRIETINNGLPADVAAPTRSRATITLSNGQRVDLDSATTGALAQEGGAKIVERGDGQVTYENDISRPGALLYNTLTNPRGSRVVNLTLNDGTKVWLNAESSIRYPVLFPGADRSVEITGEAYLEVAADAHRPFRVTSGATTVDVLGTAFDINTYSDEPAGRVTLVQGAVRVGHGNELMLHPGQQAVIRDQVSLGASPDIDKVLAWKNGWLEFQDVDLPTMMRQLARWYDISISFEGNIPKRQFNGRLDNRLSLDEVLHILMKTRIHYTISPDRHLIVRP